MVLQFQIIQEDYNDFSVYLVLDDEEDKYEVEEEFGFLIREYEYAWRFALYFVDNLYPSEKTGKLAWFVSKVKR